MKLKITAAAIAAGLMGVSSARATSLYNGALGTSVDAQGYLAYNGIGASTNTMSGAITTLNSSSSLTNEAGYSNYAVTFIPPSATLKNPAFPVLNSTAGFDLDFTAKVDAETHGSYDRGGFDVILLDQNHVGVEIDFWTDQAWAQNVGFTHGESTAGFNTTSYHNYDLHISNGAYTLSADNSVILTGTTRDYSASGTPYTLPNYVFLGDDTTSASTTAEFTSISVVPEPAAVGAMAFAMIAIVRRRRAMV